MSKSKQPNYYIFAVLLVISLTICSALIAIYAGFAKANPASNITSQWFTVMTLLVATLVSLFFSIKGRRDEYRRRCQIENILTIILGRIRLEGENTENSVAESIIDQVVIKPIDYQEYLHSLRDHPQEALTQFCLRTEIDLREKMSNRLLRANQKGEGPNSFSASENNERDNRLLAKYEQIRSYLV